MKIIKIIGLVFLFLFSLNIILSYEYNESKFLGSIERECRGEIRSWNSTGYTSMNTRESYSYKTDKVTFRELNLGDRIVFYKPTNVSIKVHHGIVAKGHNFVITQGYNNTVVDNYRIYEHHIIGRECNKK